jgi:hypothetical protein
MKRLIATLILNTVFTKAHQKILSRGNKIIRAVLHLENLDASVSRSETPGKFGNVVLVKNGKDQLD